MRNLSAPGVYIREVEVKPPPRLRLDITGFVGQAEHGPLNFPQPLTGLGEYRDVFGDFIGDGYLPYCVFTFFANSGEKCYVVRVAHDSATTARLETPLFSRQRGGGDDSIPLIQVDAINQGSWGDGIEVVAEEASNGDLILTELETGLDPESEPECENVFVTRFKSVHGLLDDQIAGRGNGDRVKLIHPRIPTRQARAIIKRIDFADGTVELKFEEPVSSDFPAGSRVLGRGFRLIFRYIRDGQLVRGEVFDNLTLTPDHERYFVRVINGEPEVPDYIERLRAGLSVLVRVTDLRPDLTKACPCLAYTSGPVNLKGGNDGKSQELAPRYFTGYEDGDYFKLPGSDGDGGLFGLAAYEAVEEIGLVAIPDLVIPDLYALLSLDPMNPGQIPEQGIIFIPIPRVGQSFDNLRTGQADMLFHCQKMGERFAIMDSPRASEIGKGENRIEEWPANFQLLPGAKYGALYYPWVRQKAADFAGRELLIPPCGHVAGIYSRSEQGRGIGKAPANEVLQGAVEFEFCLSDDDQTILNPRGINCLRLFPGRGLRVWGARTLSLDPLSIYVNVRRVALAIIKEIRVNLQEIVFEPNDSRLRSRIVTTLRLLLLDLFQSGALAGTRPEEAFFIKCDEEINPPEVVDQGMVITQIGFAPARPAEFILVTIKRTADSLSVRE
jgi:hypothetical protein